jgi:hypothetical protein
LNTALRDKLERRTVRTPDPRDHHRSNARCSFFWCGPGASVVNNNQFQIGALALALRLARISIIVRFGESSIHNGDGRVRLSVKMTPPAKKTAAKEATH